MPIQLSAYESGLIRLHQAMNQGSKLPRRRSPRPFPCKPRKGPELTGKLQNGHPSAGPCTKTAATAMHIFGTSPQFSTTSNTTARPRGKQMLAAEIVNVFLVFSTQELLAHSGIKQVVGRQVPQVTVYPKSGSLQQNGRFLSARSGSQTPGKLETHLW